MEDLLREQLTPAQVATVAEIAADEEQYAVYRAAYQTLSAGMSTQRFFTLGQVKWGEQLTPQQRCVAACRAIYAWSHSEGGTMGGKILVFPKKGMAAALRKWVSKSQDYTEIMFV